MILESGDATQIEGPPTFTLLTHCVNNRAVWGAGFVVAVADKWPDCRRHYLRWARQQEPSTMLGQTLFVKVQPNLVIANVVGQDGIGRGSLRLPALRSGLEHVARLADQLSLARPGHVLVQMPLIGCGLAGGSWEDVGPLVDEVLHRHRVRVLTL